MMLWRLLAAVGLPLSSSLKVVAGPQAGGAEAVAVGTEEARARLEAVRAAEALRTNTKRTVGGAKPVPPLSEPNATTPIVLEVSAFLDGPRCALTLQRALAKAQHPARVSFHLMQARGDTDTDCLGEFKAQHLPKACEPGAPLAQAEGVSGEACQQRVLGRSHAWLLDPNNGEGPAHQRGVATSLLEYHREDSMCLSSDSHMDFEEGWDTTLLDDWASTRNEFAVLTAYPADVGTKAGPMGMFIDLCGYTLEMDIPRGRTGGNLYPEKDMAPYLTVNWAAGLSFHRCHAEKNVPVDWHLRWIFTGEEIDRAVRLFTNGYDLYLPTNIAVTHNYSHASQAFHSYGGADKSQLVGKSRDRLNRLFQDGSVPEQAQPGAPSFGVGQQRSLQDFVRWGRVNLGGEWDKWMAREGVTEMRDDETHEFCKTLQRLPVRDEVGLVAAVGSKPDGFASDGRGGVEFHGDGEEFEVKRTL